MVDVLVCRTLTLVCVRHPQQLCDRLAREAEVMEGRWGTMLANDPSYSPNLTLERENFAITDSPRVTPPWVQR